MANFHNQFTILLVVSSFPINISCISFVVGDGFHYRRSLSEQITTKDHLWFSFSSIFFTVFTNLCVKTESKQNFPIALLFVLFCLCVFYIEIDVNQRSLNFHSVISENRGENKRKARPSYVDLTEIGCF